MPRQFFEIEFVPAQLMNTPGNPAAAKADYHNHTREVRKVLDWIETKPNGTEVEDIRELADAVHRLYESLTHAAARSRALEEMNAYLRSQQHHARPHAA